MGRARVQSKNRQPYLTNVKRRKEWKRKKKKKKVKSDEKRRRRDKKPRSRLKRSTKETGGQWVVRATRDYDTPRRGSKSIIIMAQLVKLLNRLTGREILY